MGNQSNWNKTRRVVLTGLFFATALVLSLVESAFPPLMAAMPGVKFGLSNIAVMYALFFIGRGSAFAIAVLKAGFVVMMRGPVSGFLSLCGGVLSVAVMVLLMLLFRERISYLITSICGALFHNIGQFAAISVLYTNLYLWVYLPVLLTAGVLAGAVTAMLLKVLLPAFERLGFTAPR